MLFNISIIITIVKTIRRDLLIVLKSTGIYQKRTTEI